MKRAAIVWALTLAACGGAPSPLPGPADACEAACVHARSLGCAFGAPTARGASCEDVCRGALAEGMDLGAACIAAAPSCDALEACLVR